MRKLARMVRRTFAPPSSHHFALPSHLAPRTYCPPPRKSAALSHSCSDLYSIYWAAVGTTSGTGTFAAPDQAAFVAFTLFVNVLGLFMNGTIIGSLASLVQSFNSASERKNQKLEAIREYLKFKRVPNNLKKSIMSYYSFLWNSAQTVDDSLRSWQIFHR
jgi:hypothetical protein